MQAAKKELGVQILIGLFLILIGIVLNLVSEHRQPNTAEETQGETTSEPHEGSSVKSYRLEWLVIVHHIGTAILTAGMLMVTVELYTKVREARNHSKLRMEQDRYITQLRDTQSDALLSALLPDKAIFEQIKSEIIQQPFIRRNMKAIVHLRWSDESRSAIRKVLSLSYDVENTSTISGQASIRMRLSTEGPNDQTSRIENLEITSFTAKLNAVVPGNDTSFIIERDSPRTFTEAELKDCGIVTWDNHDLQVHLKIDLDSRQSARVSYKHTTIEKLKDNCGIFCTIPTVGLEVLINPEPGIAVEHAFLHPSGRVIRSDGDITFLRIDGAMLPYQGIEFSWRPVVEKELPMSSPAAESLLTVAGVDNAPMPAADLVPEAGAGDGGK